MISFLEGAKAWLKSWTLNTRGKGAIDHDHIESDNKNMKLVPSSVSGPTPTETAARRRRRALRPPRRRKREREREKRDRERRFIMAAPGGGAGRQEPEEWKSAARGPRRRGLRAPDSAPDLRSGLPSQRQSRRVYRYERPRGGDARAVGGKLQQTTKT